MVKNKNKLMRMMSSVSDTDLLGKKETEFF